MCFLLHLRAATITAFMTKDSGSFGASATRRNASGEAKLGTATNS